MPMIVGEDLSIPTVLPSTPVLHHDSSLDPTSLFTDQDQIDYASTKRASNQRLNQHNESTLLMQFIIMLVNTIATLLPFIRKDFWSFTTAKKRRDDKQDSTMDTLNSHSSFPRKSVSTHLQSDSSIIASTQEGSEQPTRPKRSSRLRSDANTNAYSIHPDTATDSSSQLSIPHKRRGKANTCSPNPSSVSPFLGMPSHRQRLDRQRKKTLVLDLDETLIHSTSRGSRRHDFIVEVLVNSHICLYHVYKRPHVDLFLRKATEWFKIVIFTASMPEYADPVIDWLDSTRTIVSKRYFRESCTSFFGTLTKNLEVVESDLSQVCLIDNAPLSYKLNPDNGIPIETWTDDPNDEALLDLLPFLDALRFADDVRSVLSLRI
ncbi:Nuclear envelope morphology protein 1 [Batrachochytrium dendrobatidis]|nr:Nuclear envelope morphology protein 1 [Batrachochytrium dendrobatidis]KAK5665396.1 Nuclear envelope morphology protein 1 [Batrachochytrium dendrobatidis]